jgi:hypothetical protein
MYQTVFGTNAPLQCLFNETLKAKIQIFFSNSALRTKYLYMTENIDGKNIYIYIYIYIYMTGVHKLKKLAAIPKF